MFTRLRNYISPYKCIWVYFYPDPSDLFLMEVIFGESSDLASPLSIRCDIQIKTHKRIIK